MKKALIVYGGWDGHYPVEISQKFKDILEKEGFEVDRVDNLEVLLGDLTKYDLFIPVWTMGEMPAGASNNIAKAVENGMGIAGCHGGMCDAFRNDCLWQFITGSQWVEHPGGDGVKYTVNFVKDVQSELIDGMEDFEVQSEHYYIHIDPAVKVYATTTFDDAEGAYMANGRVEVPVIYTKMWGKGKIYYNTLGHHKDLFEKENICELMRRGFVWATRGGNDND